MPAASTKPGIECGISSSIFCVLVIHTINIAANAIRSHSLSLSSLELWGSVKISFSFTLLLSFNDIFTSIKAHRKSRHRGMWIVCVSCDGFLPLQFCWIATTISTINFSPHKDRFHYARRIIIRHFRGEGEKNSQAPTLSSSALLTRSHVSIACKWATLPRRREEKWK